MRLVCLIYTPFSGLSQVPAGEMQHICIYDLMKIRSERRVGKPETCQQVSLTQVPALACGHLEYESGPSKKDAGDVLLTGMARSK